MPALSLCWSCTRVFPAVPLSDCTLSYLYNPVDIFAREACIAVHDLTVLSVLVPEIIHDSYDDPLHLD